MSTSNALAHFKDQPISSDRIYANIVWETVKMQNNLQFRKRYQFLIANFNQIKMFAALPAREFY